MIHFGLDFWLTPPADERYFEIGWMWRVFGHVHPIEMDPR
jgi:hypothetical protein